MSEELEQCPFCGCSVEMNDDVNYPSPTGQHDYDCPLEGEDIVATQESWNRRATPPAAQVQTQVRRDKQEPIWQFKSKYDDAWKETCYDNLLPLLQERYEIRQLRDPVAQHERIVAALSAPTAAGWTRAELHDDISGDFEGYCWIDGRTGQRHWLPRGVNPNEKEPTRANGGPHRCLFAPEGWACIKQAQHDGPCMAVKLTDGECHAAPPAAGVPDECPHMIVFDDAEVSPITFAGAGARQGALAKWKLVSNIWNAHLFVRIEKNSRDDRYPCAVVAPTPPASEQQQAVVLPEEIRNLLSRASAEILHLAECTENLGEDLDDDDGVGEDVSEARALAEDIREFLRLNPLLAGVIQGVTEAGNGGDV